MRRVHIAIVNVPGAVHVHPTLTIVSTLIRRGYRVTYVTSERFRVMLAEMGADVVLCPRWEPPYGKAQKGEGLPMSQQYSTDLADLSARTLAAITAFYDHDRPDFVLYDAFAFSGIVLAHRFGIPAVRITTHLSNDEPNLKYSLIPSRASFMASLSASFDQLLCENGVEQKGFFFRRDVPTIYFYLRELQLSYDRRDDDSIYAARCAAERPYSAVWKPKRAVERQCVLVTASTTYVQGPKYYRACAEAVSGCGMQAVLAVGSKDLAAALDPLPPNCEVVCGVPQIMIMPCVDLIIFTGGMTSAMEALYHGLPLLMLTHGHPEVEMYAENFVRHRLGLHLQSAITAEAIAEVITRMSKDFELHSNVARIRDRVRASPGGEDAVNWIEGRLAK